MTQSESIYLTLDAMYRLHEDLFHIEAEHMLGHRLAIDLARNQSTGRIGALVAGLLALVPILTSLADITLTSTPAIIIYLLIIALIGLWLYQGYEASATQKALGLLATEHGGQPLADRPDYMLETISGYAIRAKLAEQVLYELAQTLKSATTESERTDTQARIDRYGNIRDFCDERVKSIVEFSAKAVAANRRTQAEHEELLRWARPRLGNDNRGADHNVTNR